MKIVATLHVDEATTISVAREPTFDLTAGKDVVGVFRSCVDECVDRAVELGLLDE